MIKNIDFVACAPERDIACTFRIAGKAETMSESFSEILAILDKLIELADGFFVPTKIFYILTAESHDGPVYTIIRQPGNRSTVKSCENWIAFDEGVSITRFKNEVNCIECPEGSIKFFRRIEVYGKTRFVLNGKDLYIDENSPEELYACPDETGERMYRTTLNPLWIRLALSTTKDKSAEVELSDSAYYIIRFETSTEIWFENTPVGLANRNRLRNLFKKLENNFQVVGVSTNSDRYNVEKQLEKVIFGSD